MKEKKRKTPPPPTVVCLKTQPLKISVYAGGKMASINGKSI